MRLTNMCFEPYYSMVIKPKFSNDNSSMALFIKFEIFLSIASYTKIVCCKVLYLRS